MSNDNWFLDYAMATPVQKLSLTDIPDELFGPLAESIESEDCEIAIQALIYLYVGAKTRLGYPQFTTMEIGERLSMFAVNVATEDMRRRGQVSITPATDGLFGDDAIIHLIEPVFKPPVVQRAAHQPFPIYNRSRANQGSYRMCRAENAGRKCRMRANHGKLPHKWWDNYQTITWTDLDKEAVTVLRSTGV